MPGGGLKKINDYAEYHRPTSPVAIPVNDDGITFSPITGMELALAKNFSVTAGVLKYLNGARKFLVNGTSDLAVNKAADITYALVVNGTPIPSEFTTVSFVAAAKIANISITAIAMINQNDEIEIHVKGDGTAAVIVTIDKLDVTLVELE